MRLVESGIALGRKYICFSNIKPWTTLQSNIVVRRASAAPNTLFSRKTSDQLFLLHEILFWSIILMH